MIFRREAMGMMNLDQIPIFKMKSFLIILFCLCSNILVAQNSNLPYKGGESLTYIMNYKWGAVNTDVGEAVTNLELNDNLFHCVIKGRTYKFYDIFFRVREHFETKFTADMRPQYFYRDSQEGKYRMRNTYHFDNSTYKIKAAIQRYENPVHDTLLSGTVNTYDIVSLFYKMRNFVFVDSMIGAKQPISFAIDDDIYNFYFIYKGKSVKKIPKLGTFNTLMFSVRLVAGTVFSGEEEMNIWVTDDANKIPLLFESPISVGDVSGRLSKFSGLKYPLASKIK